MSNLVKRNSHKKNFSDQPHLTLIKNDEYYEKVLESQTLKTDPYYQEEIFPIIEKEGCYFNMWVFFFSSYWYAYKGMWQRWAIFTLPLHAFFGLSIALGFEPLTILVGIPVCYYLASTANTHYYMYYSKEQKMGVAPKVDNIMSGVLGVVANIFVFFITAWTVILIKYLLI
ncbi:MAG: DUF2628 domain-containing protein [Oligoflexia bacterium]|nr:DUF2628 domain-containing protein [Oligoflexia bacterium]